MSETTATRMGRFGRALTLAVCGAVWLVAATFLWRTSTPSLDLGGLDEHDYFSARAIERAADYANGARAIWLLATLATLTTLIVLVRRLPRVVRTMGIGRVGSAIVAGMVVLTTVWLVTLPFGIASLWWQHHWGLGPFDIWAWFVEQWDILLANAVFALLAIAVVVALAARFRRWWWIPGAAVFIGLAVLLVFVSGWLLASGTTALDDPQLVADVERLERAQGVDVPVREWEVSDWTDQANAFAAGFGPSTHVVLWDTLLDGRFARGEVNVVVSHELGHVQHVHILKGLAWYALFALPTAFVIAEVTRRRGGMRDPGNVALAVLVVTVVGLVLAPFQNAVTRRYEAEADWRALVTTRDAVSAKELFRGFQDTSLQEPNPPLLDYLWLETHPTLMQRIAMAEAFAEREGSP